MGLYTLLYSLVGSSYAYRVAPFAQSSKIFSGRLWTSAGFSRYCYAISSRANIIRLVTSSVLRLLTFPLARVYQHTSTLGTEVNLTWHGRRTKLSLRAFAPSPAKSSGLINPRWRIYIDFLKKDSKGSLKKIRAF